MARGVIDYEPLIDNVLISKTETVYTFSSSRKLSDYSVISIQVQIGDYYRHGITIPVANMNSAADGMFSITNYSGVEWVETVLYYYSDTQIKMKYNASGTFTMHVNIDGFIKN